MTLQEVLYLHEQSLLRFGGSSGIRDLGMVESAVGAAENTFGLGRGDLYEIAAAYAFHIAESQAFLRALKNTRERRRISISRIL